MFTIIPPSIFLFYWLNSHVNYDGDIYLTVLLNGFIHTVVFTYYILLHLHTHQGARNRQVPSYLVEVIPHHDAAHSVRFHDDEPGYPPSCVQYWCEENTSRVITTI
eukprot:scaffold439548_cov145-Attheya_sp.AAC.2